MFKKIGGGFTLVGLILAGCVLALTNYNVKYGIDLQGGTELTYTLDLSQLPGDRRATAAEEVKTQLVNRMNAFGLKSLPIAVIGSDTLVVQIPEADDNEEVEDLKRRIQTAGQMTIHLVAPPDPSAGSEEQRIAAIEEEWAQWRVQNRAREDEREKLIREARQAEDESVRAEKLAAAKELPEVPEPSFKVVPYVETGRKVIVHNDPANTVEGSLLVNAFVTMDEAGLPAAGFEFGQVGASEFAELTQNNLRGSLAIVLDDVAQSVATINSRISNSGIISGQMDLDEVSELVTILKAGSLPVKPQLDSESRVGALLGKESVEKGKTSMMIGFVLVLVFLLVYYRPALGSVAAVSLLINLTMVLTLLVVFRNALTLPGLAGFLLTVGMAVDANILIYERIREERKRGRGLHQSITNGYGKAFSTILDANLTTLITAAILFQFGTGPVKGFAVVLAIGILTSFFTSLYVSRLFVTALVRWGVIKDVKMLTIVDNPSINFLALRSVTKKASIIMIVAGMLCLIVDGSDALGLDFTGGTRVIVNLKEPIEHGEFEKLIAELPSKAQNPDFQALRASDLVVQARRSIGDRPYEYSIETRVVDDESTGSTGTEGVPNRSFKTELQTLLGERVAPDVLDVNYGTDARRFEATAYVRDYDGEEPLTVDDFRAAFGDLENEVDLELALASVELAPKVGIWDAFKIAAEVPDGADHLAVEREVRNRLDRAQEQSKLQLSNAFPEVNRIGGRVSRDLQSKVFVAMMLAFAAIVFYVSLRFHLKFGLAAIVALVHDIAITLGALALGDLVFGSFLNLKIDLPVVAALLTVVGYSLNDTIVVFDRIRENLDGRTRGVDWEQLVNDSINQALSRTLLTSVTTFVVVVILLAFGGAALQGFAFALAVGIFVGTYSSIYIASPALLYFHRRSEARRAAILAEAAAGSS